MNFAVLARILPFSHAISCFSSHFAVLARILPFYLHFANFTNFAIFTVAEEMEVEVVVEVSFAKQRLESMRKTLPSLEQGGDV